MRSQRFHKPSSTCSKVRRSRDCRERHPKKIQIFKKLSPDLADAHTDAAIPVPSVKGAVLEKVSGESLACRVRATADGSLSVAQNQIVGWCVYHTQNPDPPVPEAEKNRYVGSGSDQSSGR